MNRAHELGGADPPWESSSGPATGNEPSLSKLLESVDKPPLPVLVRAVANELRQRIARGEPTRVEEYLARHPELGADPDLFVDLLYAEYCARRAAGEHVDASTYYRRFPQLEVSLAGLFCLHSLVADNASLLVALQEGTLDFPSPGERFLDFELLAQIGQGAFARVYLARQLSLAGRHVVLKVTRGKTQEPATLARLTHPNIVPVYSVHFDEATGLVGICMPYQGAVSMNAVSNRWGSDRPRRAAAWIDTTRELLRDLPEAAEIPSAEPFPVHGDFVYATVWLMRQCASALAHAHSKGILHLDLKPSNLLITRDGVPLLVDFNLAWNESGEEGHDTLIVGGTLPFMPPEQILVLQQQAERRAPAGVKIDARADVFGLAATFYALLTGRLPFPAPEETTGRSALLAELLETRNEPPLPPSHWNRQIPGDLDEFLVRCLHPDPAQRPASAREVHEQLGLFLSGYVLPSARSRLVGTRILRFARRHRRFLAFALVGTALATGMTLVGRNWLTARAPSGEHEPEPTNAQQWFARGYQLYVDGRYEEAVVAFRRAIELGHPRPTTAYVYLATVLARLNRDAEALEAYERAIEHEPSNLYAQIGRALLLAGSPEVGNVDEARAAALECLRRIEADPEAAAAISLVDLARCFAYIARQSTTEAERRQWLTRAANMLVLAHERGLAASDLERIVQQDNEGLLTEISRDARLQQLLHEAAR